MAEQVLCKQEVVGANGEALSPIQVRNFRNDNRNVSDYIKARRVEIVATSNVNISDYIQKLNHAIDRIFNEAQEMNIYDATKAYLAMSAIMKEACNISGADKQEKPRDKDEIYKLFVQAAEQRKYELK